MIISNINYSSSQQLFWCHTDGGICVIYRKYDLKGSTVDREASDKEKEKDLPTLKDNDFVKDGTKVVIGDEAKERLMETLTADVEVTD